MRVSGATSWIVLFQNTDQADQSTQFIRGRLDSENFQTVPWIELADFYNKTVTLFSKQVNVVKFIIALIIVLTISNTQMMNVLERTTEIGTSLAIGLRKSQVMRLFLLEGCFIGLLGGTLGIVLGYASAHAISAVGIPMPPPPGMAHGYLGQILVAWPLVLDSLLLAIITTLLASIFPAWKASSLNIVDALRCNQ